MGETVGWLRMFKQETDQRFVDVRHPVIILSLLVFWTWNQWTWSSSPFGQSLATSLVLFHWVMAPLYWSHLHSHLRLVSISSKLLPHTNNARNLVGEVTRTGFWSKGRLLNSTFYKVIFITNSKAPHCSFNFRHRGEPTCFRRIFYLFSFPSKSNKTSPWCHWEDKCWASSWRSSVFWGAS